MTDTGDCEIYDAPRQSAGVHQFTGENKERDGEEREGIGARDHVLSDDLGIEHAHVPHEHDAAEHQREGDRHADCHGAEQRNDEDDKGH